MAKSFGQHLQELWKQFPRERFPIEFRAWPRLGQWLGRSRRQASASSSPPAAGERSREVHRRQLTVLFVDLVASTELARTLDPEDWREVLIKYHQVARDEISRHGGHTAQYLGDGVLAYFGFPESHEDDPARAVRAGLALLRATSDLGPRILPVLEQALHARVGIHTGTVVLGEMGDPLRAEYLAVGEVPNLASKAQLNAPIDTVIVTAATEKLTRGRFTFRQHKPADISVPMELYVVAAETTARTRLDWSEELTSFVDRQGEMERLLDAWRRTRGGARVAILISGEPGAGKSRFLREFVARVDASQVFDCTCSAQRQNSPFYPLVDVIQRRAGITEQQPLQERLTRLATYLTISNLAPARALPVLSSLLALSELDTTADTSPIKERRETIEVMLSTLLSDSTSPVVLIIDDVQWADPSTLEFVGLALQSSSPSGILVLLATRAGLEINLSGIANLATLELPGLTAEHSRALVTALTSGATVQRELMNFLVERSNGLPLYIEELTHHVLDTGMLTRSHAGLQLTGSLSDIHVPATMQAFLATKLDGLGHTRSLVQAASVIGLTFESTLLAGVVGQSVNEVERSLAVLARMGVVVVLRKHTHEYAFRHALLREAAYQMLSRDRRSQYHRTIAETLQRTGDHENEHPEVLAYHFTGAADAKRAAELWRVAGVQAIGRFALLEAMDAFQRGLASVADLDASRDRDQLEVELLSGLGFTCIATKGFSAKEVEDVYSRARDRCQAWGETPVRVRFGIWAVYVVRGDRETTAEMARDWRRIAIDERATADERLVASACLGTLHFYLGDTELARQHMERGIELCDVDEPRQQNDRLMALHGYDGLLFSHLFLAWNALYVGQTERADALMQTALDLARRIATPFCTAMASAFAASLARDQRKLELAREHAGRAIALSLEYGYPFWLAAGLFAAGWAECESGNAERGFQQINQGLQVYSQIGARVSTPYYLSYLVEAHLAAGQLDDAERAVDEALSIAALTIGVNYEPELLHLKAQIADRRGRAAECELYLQRGLEQAGRLGLRLFESRLVGTLDAVRQRAEADALKTAR